MSLFDTFFGVVGEDTALMLLVAPLVFDSLPWLSGLLFLGINVLAGGKTSTGLLGVLLIARLLFGVRRRWSWQRLSAIMAIVCGLAFAMVWNVNASTSERPIPAIYGDQVGAEAGGLDGRVELWKGAFTLMPTAPLLGYGFEGDREAMLRIASWSGSSHNSYLEMALCGGLVGFAILMCGVLFIARECIRTRTQVRLYLFSLLIFILIDSITGGILDNPSFIGMFLVAWLYYRAKEPIAMAVIHAGRCIPSKRWRPLSVVESTSLIPEGESR